MCPTRQLTITLLTSDYMVSPIHSLAIMGTSFSLGASEPLTLLRIWKVEGLPFKPPSSVVAVKISSLQFYASRSNMAETRWLAVGAGPTSRRWLKQASTGLFLVLLFSAFAVLYTCRGWIGESSALLRRPMVASPEITLANDLENTSLERFDKLVSSGDSI